MHDEHKYFESFTKNELVATQYGVQNSMNCVLQFRFSAQIPIARLDVKGKSAILINQAENTEISSSKLLKTQPFVIIGGTVWQIRHCFKQDNMPQVSPNLMSDIFFRLTK